MATTIAHEMSSPFVGGATDQLMTKSLDAKRASADFAKATFRGWRRENGRVGVRNHVVILPLDDLSNAATLAARNTRCWEPARQSLRDLPPTIPSRVTWRAARLRV